ncbi:equilibrative nucleoside transporter 1-like isoform X6 [Mobula birostris]|uniref:equilibrative nucleoside transporter 1-like isoform X6 n=1 Tax=Mobula birostris TaxID=1983395 RepID=UPI003B2871B8
MTKMREQEPVDRFKAVWLIFLILGLGTLLPWNFFMTAIQYFKYRLQDVDDSSAVLPSNGTSAMNVSAMPRENQLQGKFGNVMTLCAMLPMLIFSCLNSLLLPRISQTLRISGSIIAIFILFLLTAILEFSRYHFQRKNEEWRKAQQEESFSKMDLIKQDPACTNERRSSANLMETHIVEKDEELSVINILRKIWPSALLVWLVFAVTISVFPSVTVDAKSTISADGLWGVYFIPISCFLMFNVFDWLGRSLTAVCMWVGWTNQVYCNRLEGGFNPERTASGCRPLSSAGSCSSPCSCCVTCIPVSCLSSSHTTLGISASWLSSPSATATWPVSACATDPRMQRRRRRRQLEPSCLSSCPWGWHRELACPS